MSIGKGIYPELIYKFYISFIVCFLYLYLRLAKIIKYKFFHFPNPLCYFSIFTVYKRQ